MKKHKDGSFIECDKCGSILEYISNSIDKQYEFHSEHNITVKCYMKCPKCQNELLVDRYEIHNK